MGINVDTENARQKLLRAALRVLQSELNDSADAHYSDEREYADDMMLVAARDYVSITDKKNIPESPNQCPTCHSSNRNYRWLIAGMNRCRDSWHDGAQSAQTEPLTAETLARMFHETYERLAPEHGYETRKESAVPWEEVPTDNKVLMISVAEEILERLTQ